MKRWPTLEALVRHRAFLAERGLAGADDDLEALQVEVRALKAMALRQHRARLRNPPPAMTQEDWERREILPGEPTVAFSFSDGTKHYVGGYQTGAKIAVQLQALRKAERAAASEIAAEIGSKGGGAERKLKPFKKLTPRQQQRRKAAKKKAGERSKP